MLFLIYSKDNCKYCTKAKQWIEEYFGGECTRNFIEFRNPPKEVVEQLKESTGQKTYPFIYCGSTFVGGYDELNDIFKTGEILYNEYNIVVDDDF